MHFYKIKDSSVIRSEEKLHDTSTEVIAIMTQTELQKMPELSQYVPMVTEMLKNVRLCKAEVHGDCIRGVFYVPSKRKEDSANHFGYILSEGRLMIIDNNNFAVSLTEKIIKNDCLKHGGVGYFWIEFINELTKHEMEYLMKTEDKLAAFEDEILADKLEDVTKRMLTIRRHILVRTHYYMQLSDMCTVFEENEPELFGEREINEFRILRERMDRLRDQTVMLREYASQLRELCQSQFDMKQNNIMKILTVVTTIFLPMTLVVGWYGMNFVNMPELKWHYGYGGVAIFSLLIIIVCIWIFKKKKFF